jgi:perosamine synthetase
VNKIRLAAPELGQEEAAEIARVLASGMLVQGREVEAFERGVAERCQRAHAVAVSSGTAALELALRALGISSGEVLVPDLTWPSPAHVVALVNATPVLVDVDESEWNPRPESFASARSDRTKAVIAIDQFGVPARHREIEAALSGVPVIEDAACAIGSLLEGRPCGSFGIVSCLSFHPRKVITTGEGGMCLTDDASLAAELRMLRNHGQRAPGQFAVPAANFRLTEMQAAMGRVQLGRLDSIVEVRRRLADRYREKLPRELSTQTTPERAFRNEQTFGVLLPRPMSRDLVIEALARAGIESGRLSYALHTLPTLQTARRASALERASSIVERGIALPLHGGMSIADVDRVVSQLVTAIEDS